MEHEHVTLQSSEDYQELFERFLSAAALRSLRRIWLHRFLTAARFVRSKTVWRQKRRMRGFFCRRTLISSWIL